MGDVIVLMKSVYDEAAQRKRRHVDGDHWAALGMDVGEEIAVPVWNICDDQFDTLWAMGKQLGFSLVPVLAIDAFLSEGERLGRRLVPGYQNESVPDWVRSKWPDGALDALVPYSACALKMVAAVQDRMVSWLDGMGDASMTERQRWALVDLNLAKKELLRFAVDEWREN